ncbi:oligosaccharide flippase family protein [Aeromonas caviae]|uniref:oligosaccharide flippase family protein n=1 Tax=Aeromonas caviae TaxID=648 RepID=UPI002B477FBA|nr:polysaccharide biosynthesis C-terminal domain-containing protein [Aeromonas caviae]
MIIFIERSFRLLSGLLLTILLSKALPIHLYGEYSYYLSVITILSCVSTFGLDDGIKSFYLDENKRDDVISIAVYIKVLLAIITTSAFLIYLSSINAELWLYLFSGFIFSCVGTLFYSISIISPQVNKLSKTYLLYGGGGFIIKAAMIYFGFFNAFLIFFSFEWIVITIVSMKIMKIRWCNINKNVELVKDVIKSSLPLFISSLAIIGYYKSDQLILGYYLGFTENATYALASQFIIASGFFHGIYINRVFPSIFKVKDDKNALSKVMMRYYSYSSLASLFVFVFVYFGFEHIFNFIWGADYETVPKLVCLGVLGLFFSGIGLLQTQKLIAMGLGKYRMYRVIIGVLLNIFLNCLLIPYFGVYGAVYSTLLSQFFSSIFINFIFKNTRVDFYEQIKGALLLGVRG